MVNRLGAGVGLCFWLVACCACGDKNNSVIPTSPSPTPAPAPAPAPSTFSIAGAVTDQQSGRGIAAALVVVMDGPDANKAALTNSSGTYTLTDLQPGTITLSATAAGYSSLAQRVTVQGNMSQSFTLQSAKRTISGTVTDATSRGVLPNILIAVVDGPSAGQSTRSDAQGRYALVDVSSQTTGLQASATSYLTSNWSVPTGGDAQVNIVMTRTTGPSPVPVPAPPPHNPTPPANGVVITFDSGSGGLTTYTENGFTVTPSAQSWFFSGYGVPGPSLQFLVGANSSIDGEVRITAGGTRFQFQSVDVYSSVTPIPYVFTGLLGSTTVYSVAGRQGNTFGRFATVASGQSGTSIDTLLIRLTNTTNSAGGNPMGIDNVIVTR